MSVDDSLLLSFYSSNKYTFACATSDFPCKAATHFDLVSFLGVAQRGSIDFFDIQWDPIGIVGAGGSASISQHNLDLTSSLVFKRCTLSQGRIDGKSRFARFRALCCEVMILSIDFIREHRNIVTLEGICWEVDPRYEDPEVTPVLIFEKAAHGDLEKYIWVVHGDIKPRNILVFEDANGDPVVKVSDFGYSTLASEHSDAACIYLPKSCPWHAPETEHKQGPYDLRSAKVADLWCTGLTILWLLFGRDLLHELRTDGGSSVEVLLNKRSISLIWEDCAQVIQDLKNKGELRGLAVQLVHGCGEVPDNQRAALAECFDLMLAQDPADRGYPLEELSSMLDQPRKKPVPAEMAPLIGSCAQFDISSSFLQLCRLDYRVWKRIVRSLEEVATSYDCQCCKGNACFQIALCYRFGFGVLMSLEKSAQWLRRSGRDAPDFKRIENSVINATADWGFHNDGLRRKLDSRFGCGYIALKYYEDDRVDAAIAEYERSIADLSCSLGADHTTVFHLKIMLSVIFESISAFDKKAEIETGLVQNLENDPQYGFNHPNTLVHKRNLASSYQHLGQLQDAETMQFEVLRLARSVLDTQDPMLWDHMIALAAIYRSQDRYDAALDLQRETLEAQKTFYGPRHQRVAMTSLEVAATLGQKGDLTEVLCLQQEALHVFEQALGADHGDTILALGNVSATYLNLGRIKEGLSVQEQIVQLLEKRLYRVGEDDYSYHLHLANLANLYLEHGRPNDAEPLHFRAMENFRKRFGPEHSDTLRCMNDLAVTYGHQERFEEAEALESEVLEISRKRYGEHHSVTAFAKLSLAETLLQLERYVEAEELYLLVLNDSHSSLGQDFLGFLDRLQALANLLEDLGRTGQAMACYRSLVQRIESNLNLQDPTNIDRLVKISELIREDHRAEDADLRVKILKLQTERYGESHRLTIFSMARLADLYHDFERYAEAEELARKVFTLRRESLGLDDRLTLRAMGNLALILVDQECWTEAAELTTEALNRSVDILGEDDEDTVISMENLAELYRRTGRHREALILDLQVDSLQRKIARKLKEAKKELDPLLAGSEPTAL